ncbi:MAG TPA: Ig-like domain-containing protein, partial [Bdellovibrionota bacterium]|nr:Ig-like domain-containing protein [Bdellovibrionota bacterium]
VSSVGGNVVADGVQTQAVSVHVVDPKTGEPIVGLSVKLHSTGSNNVITQPPATDANGDATGLVATIKAEDKTVTIEEPVGFEDQSAVVTFIAGAPDLTNSTLLGSGPVVADGAATSTITATIRDANFNPCPGIRVDLHITGTNNTPVTTFGSPVTCGAVTDTSGQTTCTVSSTKAETKTLRFVQVLVPPGPLPTGFDKLAGNIDFIAAAPAAGNSDITGTSPVFANGISASTITISLADANGNRASGITPVFSASGSNNTVGACSASDSLGISTCTLQSTTAEVKSLSITSPFSLTPGHNVSFIPEQPSWIGTSFQFQKWGLGGNPVNGTASGAFFKAESIAYDSTNDRITVVEGTGARVDYLSHLAADFLGWLGMVDITPGSGTLGPPACTTTTNGQQTPGWCIDGQALQPSNGGNGLGELREGRGSYLTADGSLYVAESLNHRVLKYDTTNGTFVGWIGEVGSVVPTGNATGVVGCTGKSQGTFSAQTDSAAPEAGQGWCTGGRAQASAGDNGGFSSPFGVFVDESVSPKMLYVADRGNHRISRYELLANNGVNYTGSIGFSSTTNCGSNAVTSGFCVPTSGAWGATDFGFGGMSNPSDVAVYEGFVYVADTGNHRVSKFRTDGSFVGWIGRIGGTSPIGGATGCTSTGKDSTTPGWCIGGQSETGTGNGAFKFPGALDIDDAGQALFVADSTNNRVVRYEISHDTVSPGLEQATYTGWIGKVATSPNNGGNGCAGRAVGTATPSWCQGGTAALGAGDGMFSNPSDVKITPGGYLMVADTDNSRVERFNAANGAFDGWSGMSVIPKVDWNPSTQPAASSPGAGDGMFNSSHGVWVENNGVNSRLYAVDTNNHRILRFNALTGAFTGWIGAIGTQPTGGDAGCSSAAVGTFTPGWCTGGTSATGAGDGMLNLPWGITGDDLGFIYVTDTGHNRVIRYNTTTGQPFGWVGRVSTTVGENPTGSNVGTSEASLCLGTAAGEATPRWCVGGKSAQSTGANPLGDGSMKLPQGVTYAGGNIYVADTGNSRIYKFQANTGFMVGWLGKINNGSPGAPHNIPSEGPCNGTLVTIVSPGWCKQGNSVGGVNLGDGSMSSPGGVAVSGNFLYVADTGFNRIARYDISASDNTVTYGGWIGRVASTVGMGGCAGAAVGSFTPVTPTWCSGGQTQPGTAGDGSMTTPMDVTASATHLFVADKINNRVNKYTVAGAFVGWQGKISNNAGMGGAAGCNTALVGDATPGWCTGGLSAAGTFDRMLNAPESIHIQSNGNYLYVGDSPNHRIMRFPTP